MEDTAMDTSENLAVPGSNKMAAFLESRVNAYLKKKDSNAEKVIIRVQNCSDRMAEDEPRSQYPSVTSDDFPIRNKVVLAFEKNSDGREVCFFGMQVHEWRHSVCISHVDGVPYSGAKLTTPICHEILIGFLDYAKILGYTCSYISVCPPRNDKDSTFLYHPIDDRAQQFERLERWYREMLDKAVAEGVIVDYLIMRCADDRIEDRFGNPVHAPALQALMKEANQILFIGRLNPSSNADPADDPDPNTSEDLTITRAAFATIRLHKEQREDEFCMRVWETHKVVESLLHDSRKSNCTFICGRCKTTFETMYCCTECDDLCLCTSCYEASGHSHIMKKLDRGPDEANGESAGGTDGGCDNGMCTPIMDILSDKKVIEQFSERAPHANRCCETSCRRAGCPQMKRIMEHVKSCKPMVKETCPICLQFITLCCSHANDCTETTCLMPLCRLIKEQKPSKMTSPVSEPDAGCPAIC